MCRKQKKKDNSLKRPSLFKRLWKVWVYNLIWTAVFFSLFLCFYTLDDVAFELDWFMMYGLTKLRWQLITTSVTFWFFFRQIFKDLNLIKFSYLTSKHDVDVVKRGGCKRMYEGEEGLGKTINTAFDTLLVACQKDRAMRLAYYLKYPYAEELQNDVDFKVLKNSFDYFEERGEYLPHVMANFEIIYQGRKNYPFSMEYIDQTRRLAEGFACALTEVGNIMPNAWRMPSNEEKDKHNLRTKNETLSLSRQYFDLTIIADEQRTGEVYLGFRSVVSSNTRLTARKKVLRPILLEKIQVRLEDKILRRKEKTSKFLAWRYRTLSRFIEDVGFYVFTYNKTGARDDKVEETDLNFVVSCDIPFEFDTRGERFNYKLLSKLPS